jgi:general secretion pathway protein D
MASTSRLTSPTLALAIVLVFTTTSCSMLPPSLRGAHDEAQPATPTATAQNEFGPKAGPSAKDAGGTTTATPPKTYPGTGVFVNPKPAQPPAKPGPEEASLNFESLDVREVAKVILGDYLKETYTVHPAVTGTVTFRTLRPIPMKDLLPTLEMLLRQNNAAVVREEGVYKILPIAAVRGSVSPQLGGSSIPLPQGFSVLVVPLKFVGAREMSKLLEPFAADNTIRIDEVRNLVVIAGNQRELKHLVDTIELFDVDWLAGYSVGLFPIRSSDVKALMGDMDKIFGGAGQGPLAGVVRVIPIERLNALLVVTTQPRYLEIAKTWLERLDQAGGTSGGFKFYVYQVRNGKAENLAQLVGDLFSARRTTTSAPSLAPGSRPTELRSTPFGPQQGQTTTTTVTPPAGSSSFQIPGSTGGGSGEVRVIADKDTNSLLILAAPSDYEVVEGALRKLDVARRQVLVEVLLAEVTLTDDLQFGVDWFLRAKGNTILGAQNTPIGRDSAGVLPNNNPITPPTTITQIPNYNGLQLINLSGTEVRAVLRALGADGKTKVVAAPAIMVLDNEKAEIKVGNRISVQTQTQTGVSTGTGVINSYQYLETGVLLAVTPRINSGGMVTLELNQEVSQPLASAAGTGNPNPDVATRNAKTSVQVASGEAVVLGGLIQQNDSRTTSGIPLLSKIPILGAAFGSQVLQRSRTELVMMVTPKIISDPNQAREVTEELRRKLPALEGIMPPRPTTPVPEVNQPVAK